MHTHHRRAARKADKAGVEVRITVGPTDLAAFRAGRELPGVDLTYIRAAVRTRRAPPKKDEPNDPSGDRGL